MKGIIHQVELTRGNRSFFKDIFENDLARDQAFSLQNHQTLFPAALPTQPSVRWEQTARQDRNNFRMVC
jgi:hypothetical protein